MRAPLFCCLLVLLGWQLRATAALSTSSCAGDAAALAPPRGRLTLDDAVHAALSRHPALRVADCAIDASTGRRLQAGLRPNPVAGFAVENFAGTQTRRGLESAETTLQVSQLIELGHKRLRRAALADAERELAVWQRESRRLAVITATRQAFVDVLAAQARLRLAQELSALSASVFATVAAKVKAGKVSPVEASRAQVDVQRTSVASFTAQTELERARRQLALQWAEEPPALDADSAAAPSCAAAACNDAGAAHCAAPCWEARGTLSALPARPSYAQLARQLAHNPALARWPSELARRQRALELAGANGVQDLTLSGGLRQFGDTDDVGIVFGVSLPLPLFDRNQGVVLAAQADIAAADAAQAATRQTLLSEVFAQHQALTAAVAEETMLREQTLPLAQRIFDATSEGYRQGKFGLIDVLDAQRTLFASRALHVDALARSHRAAAALEGLTGVGLAQAAAGVPASPSSAGDLP